MDIFQYYGKSHKSFEFPIQARLRRVISNNFWEIDDTAFLNLVLYYRAGDLVDTEDPSETAEGRHVLETLGSCSPVEHKYAVEHNVRKQVAVAKSIEALQN